MSNQQAYERIPFDDMALPIRINHKMQTDGSKTQPIVTSSWHEQIELLHFHQGKVLVTCGGQTYVANAGDVFIINPFELHRLEYMEDAPCYDCIMIDSSFYRDAQHNKEDVCFFDLLSDNRIRFETLIQNDQEINGYLEKICREDRLRPPLYDVAIRANVISLLIALFRRHAEKNVSFYRVINNLDRYARIQPALELMRRRLGEHITLTDLANECHISTAHFSRIFRQITGCRPIQYLLDLRLQEAATLLKRTDKPISTIAYEVGFDDVGYFSRKFKEQFGISPTKAKRQ